MGRINNALKELFQREPNNGQKTNVEINSVSPLSREYFRRGNQIAYENLQKDKHVNETELYSGYLYAALDLRKNSFAEFAEDNIITKTDKENIEDIYHPYLKLIEESKTSTEFEFWQDLITDWDMKGEAFLFILRRVVYDEDKKDENGRKILKHIGKPVSIQVLDANKVTKLTNEFGIPLGYKEQIDSNHQRIFAPEQIIHIINKNPFNKRQPYSIFQAAKDYQYTLEKGKNYTQSAIANNINTPGILSTDQILNDSEYDNLVAKINSHEAGQVIVTDGAGKLNYTGISQALDSTSLSGISDVTRQVIFAVTGTSKTMLGIEESGTTRETSRIQYQKFIQKTITPIVKKVISTLNFDYRFYYPNEYNYNKLDLYIKEDSDPEAAKQGYETQKALFDSIQDIVYSGYTPKSAEEFMLGEISFTELEEEKPEEEENDDYDNLEDDESGDSGENPPEDNPEDTPPEAPQEEIPEELPEEENLARPLTLDEIYNQSVAEDSQEHNHHHGESLESWIDNTLLASYKTENGLSDYGAQVSFKLKSLYKNLLKDIRKEDLKIIKNSDIIKNARLQDIRSEDLLRETIGNIGALVKKFLRKIAGIASSERKEQDKNDWGLTGNVNILGEKQVNQEIDEISALIAESHVNTIYGDLLANIKKQEKKNKTEKLTDEMLGLAMLGSYRRSINQRSKVLSEDIFMRGIGIGYYWTDFFLVGINRVEKQAYKVLVNNYPDPCEYCQEYLGTEIPLTENFIDVGHTTSFLEAGNTKSLTNSFLPVSTGTLHPNCRCYYKLIIRN